MDVNRIEYGDWQTDFNFAKRICSLLKEEGLNPRTIIEPTCGKGNFVCAALDTFDNIENVFAIEIYKPYIEEIKERTQKYRSLIDINIIHESVFDFDFTSIPVTGEILVIGNPPWITNSQLGEVGSENLPLKSNFKNNKGLEAITGKGNFDIAEYILLMLLRSFSSFDGSIAMLVKNSVIKNIVHDQIYNKFPIRNISQYEFNAQKEFGAATAASMFFAKLNSTYEFTCDSFDLYTQKKKRKFGVVDNKMIYDLDVYEKYKQIDGESSLVWRSGVKHDCSKVMELEKKSGSYTNGLHESIFIEDDYVFPLVKSSDIKSEIVSQIRKYVIVTQRSTSDDTNVIEDKAPQTYEYLQNHRSYFENRKSSIYKNRPKFCMFGIGNYSFMPYKVVISALYKSTRFALIKPIEGKPVMLDDTCYMLSFEREDFAIITQTILNSDSVQGFISSISFLDAKRLINKDLLMRIDLYGVATMLGCSKLNVTERVFNEYIEHIKPVEITKHNTLLLFDINSSF